jgi:hypothetical protein
MSVSSAAVTALVKALRLAPVWRNKLHSKGDRRRVSLGGAYEVADIAADDAEEEDGGERSVRPLTFALPFIVEL